jgi:hypothetical protein
MAPKLPDPQMQHLGSNALRQAISAHLLRHQAEYHSRAEQVLTIDILLDAAADCNTSRWSKVKV